MALKSCPECKREISTDAAACPYCGKRVSPRVATIVAALAFVLAGAVYLFAGTGRDAGLPATVLAPSVQSGVTLAAFERLKTGMTYDEAVAVLGSPGQETTRSEIAGIVTVMYRWDGAGMLGANMNAMFQNGKLVTKAQFGLR